MAPTQRQEKRREKKRRPYNPEALQRRIYGVGPYTIYTYIFRRVCIASDIDPCLSSTAPLQFDDPVDTYRLHAFANSPYRGAPLFFEFARYIFAVGLKTLSLHLYARAGTSIWTISRMIV